jgi:hypothetical protein
MPAGRLPSRARRFRRGSDRRCHRRRVLFDGDGSDADMGTGRVSEGLNIGSPGCIADEQCTHPQRCANRKAGRNAMTVVLNEQSYEYATSLIKDGKVVLDEQGDWSKHHPTVSKQNQFIHDHGLHEYGKWCLGLDESETESSKNRYLFLYGDFDSLHRCAVLAAESRAGQYKYLTIKWAAAHLHGMLDELI